VTMRNLTSILVLFVLFALIGCTATKRGPSARAGRIESGDRGYYFDWMATAPYAPSFQVLDTESSLGPYAAQAKTIALKDLVKMHGHPCDGLIAGACALKLGLDALYPEGTIDRTDTACISNNSPCYGDVAAYLTGGRIRFGTQKIDSRLGHEFILYRISTRRAVKVALKPGVFPDQLKRLETILRTGSFTLEQMRTCQRMQWDYARDLLNRPLETSFDVHDLPGFQWRPDPYANASRRADTVNKNILNER
jgi:formylmethanofuran dehydrogenase subunit E